MSRPSRPATFPTALEAFVELFNQEAFWESHEVLEGPWRENGSDFYHGLILNTPAPSSTSNGGIHTALGRSSRRQSGSSRNFAPPTWE